jgi:UDP-N-acetylglucosamine 2-epimerase (non-hydrolysing)
MAKMITETRSEKEIGIEPFSFYAPTGLLIKPSEKSRGCSKFDQFRSEGFKLNQFQQQRMRIAVVVGARPNFMKAAPVMARMRRFSDYLEPILVHTGQHYDRKLSGLFFDQLKMPQPDLYLGVGSGSHAVQTAKIMTEFEAVVLENPPDLVVVVGDVNSTLACAVVSKKCHIPVAHIEAGLRSFDMGMPEEINRVLTDRISDYLFVTESSGFQNLVHEGVDEDRIFFVGNVMIDTLLEHRNAASTGPVLASLGLESKKYALLTLHRPDNVDDPKALLRLIEALSVVSVKIPVIFPCHPRTRLNLDKFGLASYFDDVRFRLIEPQGYLDFLGLESEAAMVLTDSGGIQEETTILNVPCLTLRKNTERPVTVLDGTNILVGPYPEKIIAAAENILAGNVKAGQAPKYWDGRASERIVEVFLRIRESMLSPQPTRQGTTRIRTVEKPIVN